VPAERVDRLLDDLRREATPAAAVVGRIVEPDQGLRVTR
jgi:hypothetical protein